MPKTLKINSHKRKNKTRRNKEIKITSDFESGNILKLDSTSNNHVHLEIRGEKYEKKQSNKYRNWFYFKAKNVNHKTTFTCLLYTSPSPRDGFTSRMPSSA